MAGIMHPLTFGLVHWMIPRIAPVGIMNSE